MRLRPAPGVEELRVEERGLVFAARPVESWQEVEDELADAFRETQAAAAAGEAVVYLVRSADLLGRRGAPGAMVAGALLGAARSLALEGRRSGVRANVVAFDEPAGLEPWVATLLRDAGATGMLVQLGASHLGKVPA